MIKQSPVFIQVYILPDQVSAVSLLLDQGGNPQGENSFFSLRELDTVHFARLLIAPATDQFKASLLYSANVDGTVDEHLKDLIEKRSEDLDALFSLCVGYPEVAQRSAESRLLFLKRNSFKTPAFYVGSPGRSVVNIRKEKELYTEARQFIHREGVKWTSSSEAFGALRKHFREQEKWNVARKSDLPKKRHGLMLLFVLLMLILSPLLILGIIGIFLFYEWREKPFGKSINDVEQAHLNELKKSEDIIYQNQISQVFETKPGLRKIMLRFFLWGTNIAAKNWFVEGQLFGTPTIHFARWVFIDGGKRFVFFSNFDGSYNGYLGDFVDNNGWGLNIIYGGAKGYPRTRFMFGGGSYKILEFLGWGRITQVPTGMWYSAYPFDGLQQIVSRSELREALLGDKTYTAEQQKNILNKL